MPCEESGLDMTLLTDQSVPILYYDEIKLFEDDMHDNGYTSLTCKIRVMPTCLLCLMSLFVRVDYVLVRVKEVRIFTKFHEEKSGSECMTLWREISWRECRWNSLQEMGLPNHVQAWRLEDNTLTGKELQLHQQRIQTMINKLPIVSLPPDLSNISFLNAIVVSIL
jgi:type 2A phosphatase activator TIP41